MQQPRLLSLAVAMPLLLLALYLQPVLPHEGIVSTAAITGQRLLLQQATGDASHTSAHTSAHTSQHDLWTHSHVQQQQHGQQVGLQNKMPLQYSTSTESVSLHLPQCWSCKSWLLSFHGHRDHALHLGWVSSPSTTGIVFLLLCCCRWSAWAGRRPGCCRLPCTFPTRASTTTCLRC